MRHVLFFALVLAGPAAAQQQLFDAPWRSFDTGSVGGRYAYGLIAPDLNGDGVGDAVITQNVSSRGLRVLLSEPGPGGVALYGSEGTLYPLTQGAVTVASGDFDGDGDLDLAAPDVDVIHTGSTLALFFNSGDGTFGPRQSVPAGQSVGGVAAADFDGDGDVDLTVGNYDNARVALLLNNGAGTFGAPAYVATPASPSVLETGDLDGDGDADLAVSHDYTQMSVLLNAGDGTFGAPRVYSDLFPQGRLAEVVLLDPDGDGDLDLLHPGYFGPDDDPVLVLLRNDGTANFTREAIPYRTPPFGEVAYDLTAADLDGDGRDDAIGAQPFEAGYIVFRDDDAGGFLPGERYASAALISSHYGTVGVATTDLNADGDPDVLSVGRTPRLLTAHVNNGDGTFPERPVYGSGRFHAVLDMGDVDGDGDLDAVTSHAGAGESNVIVYRNDGGAFVESYRTPGPPLQAHAKLRDLNGDGHLDVLATSAPTSTPYDFFTALSNGDGTFGPLVRHSVGSCGFGHPEALDVDADGDLDVINTEDRGCPSVPSGQLYVSRNNGDATFQPAYIVEVLGFPFNLAGGDFNEDGHLDLATVGSRAAVVLGNGDGTFGPPQEIPFGSYVAANVLALDLDGDGHLDLASLGRDANAESFLAVLRGTGAGTFALTEYRQPPTQDFREWVAAGDVNGDGDPDLMAGGVQDALVFLNTGGGAFSFSGRYGIGEDAYSLHYADADGDGHGDLLALASQEYPTSGIDNGIVVVPGLAGGSATVPEPSVPSVPAAGLTLSAPVPNPAASRVAFTLTARAAQAVRVEAFDALGRRVAVLHEGPLAAGTHRLTFDGAVLPAGLYVIRAAGESFSAIRRVTLF